MASLSFMTFGRIWETIWTLPWIICRTKCHRNSQGAQRFVPILGRLLQVSLNMSEKREKVDKAHSRFILFVMNPVFGGVDKPGLDRTGPDLVSLSAALRMSRNVPLGERCVTSKKRLRGRQGAASTWTTCHMLVRFALMPRTICRASQLLVLNLA